MKLVNYRKHNGAGVWCKLSVRRILLTTFLVMLAEPAPSQSLPSAPTVTVPGVPTTGRIGHVRRNAQGVIEVVPSSSQTTSGQPEVSGAPSAGSTNVDGAKSGAIPTNRVGTPVKPPLGVETGTASSRSSAIASPDRSCANDVLLCLTVLGADSANSTLVPITFGHPLGPKLLRPDQRVVARFGGSVLPVQLDQVATHADGSIRFAVFSLVLPGIRSGSHMLELLHDTAAPVSSTPAIVPSATDFQIEIETFAPQVYEFVFGNRQGNSPGVPFKVGETVTLVLGEGAATETFAVTITNDMSGGQFPAYTKIAEAFVQLSSKSKLYRIHRDALYIYEVMWITTRDRPGHQFPVRIMYDGAAKISSREVQRWQKREPYLATAKIEPGARVDQWLNGSVVRESVYPVQLRSRSDKRPHPFLTAFIATRNYANVDAQRVEVTIENSKAFVEGVRDIPYNVTLRGNGKSLFAAEELTHYAFARWHKSIWLGSMPDVVLRHDRLRLLESLAVPSYDPSLRISDSAIAAATKFLTTKEALPLGVGGVHRAMPDTGGRFDIGPLPGWAVMHLLTFDPRLLAATLANGDASGTAQIHYRDPASGLPVNIGTHKSARWTPERQVVDGKAIANGWSLPRFAIDLAHQPALTAYPYMLTGERYYLEETQFWASWNPLSKSEMYRGEHFLDDEQARGKAWGLRTLSQAAMLTPDKHPLKATLNEQLRRLLDWLNRQHETASAPKQGILPGVIDNPYGPVVAPWQQDFASIVLAGLVENSVPGAAQLLKWSAGFGVGRFLSEAKGLCRQYGIGYWLKLPDGKSGSDPWREFSRLNWPDQRPCKDVPWQDAYVKCADCYTSLARAALASMVNAGIAEAREPYDFIRTTTENRLAPFAENPTFAIVPRVR